MRKLLSLLFICFAVFANARQITSNEAATIAADFLNSSISAQKAGVRVDVRRAQSKKASPSSEETEPYYVFNGDNDGGFVIISGDDRARKILGYSDKGNFDFNNLPPQLAAMLDQYAKQIEALPASAATDPSWSRALRAAAYDEDGVLLETANWGQGYPYNLQTPIIDGEHCPTGCVATAMAIVMKYHNWPDSYDWEAMPNTQLETPIESLSKLMADAGEAVLMNYTPYESEAHMNWVGHRLQQTFKYAPECQYITRANFSDEEWVSMLRGNLDSNEPVIYNGSGTGNHAFIIDGYENDTYHINWGWDGMCNGYFYLYALTPNESQDFSSNCGMVINIIPDHSGKVFSNVFCDRGYFWSIGGMCPGAHFSIDSPTRNQTFDYTCHVLSYPCNESGVIGLLLYDKDGKVKEVLKSQVFTEGLDDYSVLWGNSITLGQITINSETFPDDYLTLATKESPSQHWLEVLSTVEAPIKWNIADIKKDISVITVINNAPDSHVSYLNLNDEWIPLESNTIECVKGRKFDLMVTDESGNSRDNISIKIEGTGLYGNTEVFYESWVAIGLYSDIYTITIDEDVLGIEKDIELSEAGTLSAALKETPLSNIDMLTVTGYINAEDIWFIRENLKTLKSLDISDCKIMACEAIDPVEAFRISGSEHIENALPSFALTGLAKLSSLKLPKDLIYIESNSMMSLAIEQIEIPATVQSIGLNVFFDCERLNTVISRMPQPPAINDCIFSNTMCPASGVLYVPKGSAEIYRGIEVWQDFAQIIEGDGPSASGEPILYEGLKYRVQGESLYLIGYEQSQLPENVIIPDTILINDIEYCVLGIDDNAMQNANMKSFVMSNSITTIGRFLFSGSSVVKVIMSDNIKFLPFHCIDGSYIEELHIPENTEYICNSIYCPSLRKLHLPKNSHSEVGFNGSVGEEFRSLEEITVDTENEEWSVHDGILYWKGLSHLILVPNTFAGKLIIPDETTNINGIEYCDSISEIIFGNGIKSLGYTGIYNCKNLKHIEFNNDIILSLNFVIGDLPSLESLSMRDFFWSYDNCFCNLPSLKHVYLLNDNPVDFGNSFYENVNPNHNYFTSSLNPQVTVPDGCNIYVPGGVKASRSGGGELAEMWKYEIDKVNGIVKIEPLIEGLAIDEVVINGIHSEVNQNNIYESLQENTTDLDVTVVFTLHERQQMSTHYDAEFNAAIPSTDLSPVSEIVLSSDDVTLFIGNSTQITATVLPENAVNKTLEWISSDEDVATVDAEGNVTAVGLGEAIITATATDGSGVSATCTVIVIPTLAESLTIDPESWAAVEGETFQITVEVLPENTSDKTLEWTSSDISIATVDNTGLVTVLKPGLCTISVSTTDGSNLTAECKLDVLSGIEGIFADGATTVDVYSTRGILIKKNRTKQELNQLPAGIYIIRSASETIKVLIK